MAIFSLKPPGRRRGEGERVRGYPAEYDESERASGSRLYQAFGAAVLIALMPFPISSRWLGLCGLSLLALARCGGLPEVAGGNALEGAGSATGGTSATASGGSISLNTGNDAAGSGGCMGADCGAGGDPGPVNDMCGDGVVGTSEECDDGNSKPGDGCSGLCKTEPGYDCPTAGAACTVSQNEVCGDGIKGMHEACDDGNAQNSDGCSSQCEIEPGYTCDPSSGVCTPDAAPAVCGNGLVESGESCDDGNTAPLDGCSASCATEPGFDCVNAGELCEPAAYCGDGILQVTLGEDCDDGNRKPGDGCSASCFTEKGYLCKAVNDGVGGAGAAAPGAETCTKIWVCGNGRVDPHEACDDGNTSPADGCSATCAVEAGYSCPKDPVTSAGGACSAAPISVCGNARVEAGEYCDDGNPTNGDGCTACHIDPGYSCPAAGVACTQNERCGDGNVDLDLAEECDDRNTTPGDGCSNTCKIEPNYTCLQAGQPCTSTIKCGDGKIAGSELCDDGNKLDGDGCSSTCQVEAGWQCPVAAARCQAKACGDGVEVGNEQCDDHNSVANDGCSPTCKLEPGFKCTDTNKLTTCQATKCGDTFKEGFEQCDDGNSIPYDGCSPTCTLEPQCANGTCTAVCGDGLKFPQEACDDGNTTAGDGCSATCTVETGFTCTVVQQSPPATLDIPILYRDFLYANTASAVGPAHADFEKYSGSAQTTGLVKAQLGSDGEPVFLSTNGSNAYGQQLTDQAHFYWWYHQQDCSVTPCAQNPYDKLVYQTRAGKPTVLTLAQQPNGAYLFSSNAFFPIDDLGWVNSSNQSIQVDSGHNFSFTSELRYQFTYQGGEVLDFTGDDDVWVFINGKLAVDLGGLHPPTNGSVTLDAATATTLGLTVGQMYGITLFQAERHTNGSNYKLTLNGFVHAISQCVTKCGDGILEGNEVCDDGKNDGSYGSCASDCLSRGPYCGDSKVTNPQETCDNGVNAVTGYGNSSAQCAPGCKFAPYCGDGVISNGEECDDAANNGKGYGYCLTGCKLGDRCGDGKKNGPEQCDEGVSNGTSGSACQTDCNLKCGNGKLDAGEQCDLGTANNTGAYGGCNADCSVGPYCGDGFQSSNEVCDDGKNDGSYGTCNPGCQSANYCGDGRVTSPPETCDQGSANSSTAYGKNLCTARCLPAPYCGDKAVQTGFGEKCDDGKNDGTPGSCSADCKAFIALSSCGNGTVDAKEQCDHGANNGKASDTCDSHCKFRCGNGVKETGEQCDDGVDNGAYGTCKPDCTLAPYCGDGIKNGNEACDDGAKNVALASAYGKTVCTSACSKAPYCGDGHVQSAFEDCDSTLNCSANCTSAVLH